MAQSLNTFVDLIGDFPKPAPLGDVSAKELIDQLEHQTIPGKELADALSRGLESHGITILRIEAFDLGHCAWCVCDGHEFGVLVGIDDFVEMTRWTIQPFYRTGFRDRLRRRTHREEFERLLLSIHDTLRETPGVRDIRWFPHFDSPWELELQVPSDSPVSKPNTGASLSTVARLDQLSSRIAAWGASPLVIIPLLIGYIALEFARPGLGMIFVVFWLLTMLLCVIVIPAFVGQYAYSRWERNHERKRNEKND